MKKLALLPILAALSVPAFAAERYLADQASTHSEAIKNEDPAAQLLFQRTVRLEEGQSNTTPLDVKAGQVYTVFADCSVNCSNIKFSVTQGRTVLFRKNRGDGCPRRPCGAQHHHGRLLPQPLPLRTASIQRRQSR